MLSPKVSVIPATKRHVKNGDQFRSQTSIRVAAYCRVSTEEESQENSYASQKAHYTTMISNREGWELAGIYADEGKSGTTRKGRIRFNELMEDCHVGKIDYIITKSISRFARNTIDALDCVHELQRLHPPVGIYFERENIDTLNANSEMFLTFYSSMAQEESRSISENIKWSIQKNFRSGKPQINLKRMIGYDMCKDGNWAINPKEAEIVSYIYERFLKGISANAIARELNQSGKRTINGKIWRADAVLYILHNEKYVGDLIMQKTFTESFLTHKAVKNTGEYPQYYKKDHHPAIISRDMWNQTQELIAYRQKGRKKKVHTIQTENGEIEIAQTKLGDTSQEIVRVVSEDFEEKGSGGHAFHGMICAKCKRKMRRLSYHASAFTYAVWKCPGTARKKKGSSDQCDMKALTEIGMEQSFMEMLYEIRNDLLLYRRNANIVQSFQPVYRSIKNVEASSDFLEQKQKLLEMEIAELQKDYEKARQTLSESAIKKRLIQKQEERKQLLNELCMSEIMKENFESFLKQIENLPDVNTSDVLAFDELVFRTYILRMEVAGDQVHYKTTFGLTLTSNGNRRPIKDYLKRKKEVEDSKNPS
jgi:DNA invertase Pin-like site-specific DNA recombinase